MRETLELIIRAAFVWSARHGRRAAVRSRWCDKHQTWHYLVYPEGSYERQ